MIFFKKAILGSENRLPISQKKNVKFFAIGDFPNPFSFRLRHLGNGSCSSGPFKFGATLQSAHDTVGT